MYCTFGNKRVVLDIVASPQTSLNPESPNPKALNFYISESMARGGRHDLDDTLKGLCLGKKGKANEHFYCIFGIILGYYTYWWLVGNEGI